MSGSAVKGQANIAGTNRLTYAPDMSSKLTQPSNDEHARQAEHPLTPEQREELDRRLEAHERNPQGGRLLEDAIKDLRRRL